MKKSKPTGGKWQSFGETVFSGKNCIAMTDTEEANARIMAQSKEMLKLLKDFLKCSSHDYCECKSLHDRAGKIINLAEHGDGQ